MADMMKYHFYFSVMYDGKRYAGTYGNATRADLKRYVENYFPIGEGRTRALLDMRTLRVSTQIEQ